jgi:hypothetical protein
MKNRREFLRVPLHFTLDVLADEKGQTVLKSQDLSLRGVYLSGALPQKLGESCELKLHLGEGDDAICIEIMGRIVRVDETGVGVEFLSVKGAAALAHLRNLILYNSDDPEEAEKFMLKHHGIERIKE